MNRAIRYRITRSEVIAVLAMIVIAVLVMTVTAQAQGTPPNRAGLVIIHGDGNIDVTCVEFAEESITGSELLQRAGMDVVLDAYGGLGYGVCAIDGEGCAAGQDCFCQCRSSPCSYWVYSHLQPDGTWAISGMGASSWRIHRGDVDGWIWGDGSQAPPEDITFDDVCRPDSATPVAVSTIEPPQAVTSAPLPSPFLSSTPIAPDNAEPGASSDKASQRTSLWSYAIFGIIVLSLAAWLIISRSRQEKIDRRASQ